MAPRSVPRDTPPTYNPNRHAASAAALVTFKYGQQNNPPCTQCRNGTLKDNPFDKCVSDAGRTRSKGACASCSNVGRGSSCSLHLNKDLEDNEEEELTIKPRPNTRAAAKKAAKRAASSPPPLETPTKSQKFSNPFSRSSTVNTPSTLRYTPGSQRTVNDEPHGDTANGLYAATKKDREKKEKKVEEIRRMLEEAEEDRDRAVECERRALKMVNLWNEHSEETE
ncbi:MAG: hypothetical protein M1823_006293 [Watsoniomyces obsoletus]|nr:MAG: hypothetical protein M1823_006293 [Watsoniomyces obsoletus]